MKRAAQWFKTWTWLDVAVSVIGTLLGAIIFFAAFAFMVLFGTLGSGGLT